MPAFNLVGCSFGLIWQCCLCVVWCKFCIGHSANWSKNTKPFFCVGHKTKKLFFLCWIVLMWQIILWLWLWFWLECNELIGLNKVSCINHRNVNMERQLVSEFNPDCELDKSYKNTQLHLSKIKNTSLVWSKIW